MQASIYNFSVEISGLRVVRIPEFGRTREPEAEDGGESRTDLGLQNPDLT
jgi:hypothetical protein